MSDESPPLSESSLDYKTGPLGSRTRGPDERREVSREGEELFARQIALAYEREAIRLRRFRLTHPELEKKAPEVDEWGRTSNEVLATVVGTIRQLIHRPSRRKRGSPDRPGELTS